MGWPPRVAVTGVGLVTALGGDRERTFQRVAAGERGLSKVSLFDTLGMRTELAGEVIGLSAPSVRHGAEPWGESRTDRLAAMAAREAVDHAGLDAKRTSQAGLVVGASTGAMFEAEAHLLETEADDAELRTAAQLFEQPISATTARLREAFALTGPATTVCTACSSGAVAMVQALQWLHSGRVNAVVAGAADGLCRMTFAGFNALGALSRLGARPFDQERDGLTLGEGAAFLVLETEEAARARRAEVRAWLDGYALAAEAHHITQPDESARVPIELLRQSLARAGVPLDGVGFLSAHGTGTLQNDRMEARALEAVFGASLVETPVTASKGQLGHTLAAAGAIESALCVLSLERDIVLPCGGLECPDPALGELRLPKRAEPRRSEAAVCCSYGFGGTGCVLTFGASGRPAVATPREIKRVFVSAVASVGPKGRLRGREHVVYTDLAGAAPPRRLALDALASLVPERSRRFDRLTSASALAVDDALEGLARAEVGLCLGVAWFGISRTVRFLKRFKQRGSRGANPGEFPHLVPSAAAGNVSIYHGLGGPVVSVAAGAASAAQALSLARDLLDLGLARHVVAGASAEHEPLLEETDARDARSEGSVALVLSTVPTEFPGAPLACLQGVASAANVESCLLGVPLDVSPERARVLCTREMSEVSLASTWWGQVSKLDVSRSAGVHEASAGFALATASALIGAREADSVLVLCRDEAAVFAVVLGVPREAQ